VSRSEVIKSVLGGAGYYLGIYLFLRFADWLPLLLYRFGIIYYLGDWANPRLAVWTYLPSVLFIGWRSYELNIMFNMFFWAVIFLGVIFLWNKFIDLLVLWKVVPKK